MTDYQICSRCVCDTSNRNILFDENGVCSHCHMHDRLEKKYPVDVSGKTKLNTLIKKIKQHARDKKYGCVVGVSGGMDSIYALYYAKVNGLKPLAMHFDNGWVDQTAFNNIKKAVEKLNVDLHIVRHDKNSLMNAYAAFFRAGVCDLCVPCNLGVASAMSQTALENKIRFIIAGGSFRTEGVYPMSQSYWDGRYFGSVMQHHGDPGFKALNKLSLFQSFYLTVIQRTTIVQLPFYLKYEVHKIQSLLKNELDWEYGGKHHFDCLYKPLISYVHQQKFNFNLERICNSALIRSGQMSRENAIEKLKPEQVFDTKVQTCIQKLGFSEQEFQTILNSEPKTYRDFKTYHWFLQIMKLPIKMLIKLSLLPEQAYDKYFKS